MKKQKGKVTKKVSNIINSIKTKGRHLKDNIKETVLPFNFVFPSLITIASLCFGITAIRMAVLGMFERAMLCILTSAILDLFDGRVARILGVSSTFGAELDSLSDAICFGVAPAITIYFWGLHGMTFGWTAALFYAVCGVLRLARFNTMLYEAPKTEVKHSDYFTGVPIPAGAFLALIPIVLYVEAYRYTGLILSRYWMSLFFLIISGLLMVSTIPTISTKKMKINKNKLVPLLAVIGVVTALIITQTRLTYLALGFAYLLTIPYTWYKAKNET